MLESQGVALGYARYALSALIDDAIRCCVSGGDVSALIAGLKGVTFRAGTFER